MKAPPGAMITADARGRGRIRQIGGESGVRHIAQDMIASELLVDFRSRVGSRRKALVER